MAAIKLLLQIILEKYVLNATDVWNNCIVHFSSDISQALLTFDNTTGYQITESTLFSSLPERCDFFIIWDMAKTKNNFVETILESIDNQLLYGNIEFRYNKRKIIAVTHRSRLDDIKQIFQVKSLHFLVNFLLVSLYSCYDTHVDDMGQIMGKFLNNFSLDCTDINLYTHKYIGNHGNEMVHLDSFYAPMQGFRKGVDLFPDKLKDQQGRPLKVSTSDMLPHADIGKQLGGCVRVGMEYARLHNCSFIINGMDYSIPEKVPTFVADLVALNQLPTGTADVVLKLLYLLEERYLMYDVTAITYELSVSVLVPRATQVNPWRIFTMEFSIYAWLLVGVLFFIHYLVLSVLQRCKETFPGPRNNISPWIAYNLSVQQSISTTNLPTTTGFRLYKITILLQAILVITMYSSKLEGHFVNPRYIGDVTNAKEFAESDLEWGSSDANFSLPLANDHRAISQTIHKKFKALSWKEMKERVDTKQRFAILLGRSPMDYWEIDSYIDGKYIHRYKILEDYFYHWYNTAHLRKSSVLTESMSQFIMYAWDHGLFDIWNRQTVYTELNKPVQRYLNNALYSKKKARKLQLKYLIGVFAMWGCGLIVSCCIFCYEYFGSRNRRL